MDEKQLLIQITDIVAKQLDVDIPETLTPDVNLCDMYLADTFDMLAIVYAIEDELDIRIPVDDVDTVVVVNDLLNGIEAALINKSQEKECPIQSKKKLP